MAGGKLMLIAFVSVGGVLVLVVLAGFCLLRASLPVVDGQYLLAGLSAPAQVEFDSRGVPRIQASTRTDAYQVLGFVTARDRLFQMDLLRRSTAGRLAEVFGPDLVETDRWNRIMGFDPLSAKIFARLPEDQQAVLKAYSAGVNAAISAFKALPFEFLALNYRPEPWRPEDCLLVVLNMAVAMSWNTETETRERTATVMRATLPPQVSTFLLPKTDVSIDRMIGGNQQAPLPVEALAELLQHSVVRAGLLSDPPPPRGSNAWVVGPSKSRSGHAILANDMHLDLSVPNLWFRAEAQYGQVHWAGLTLPGVPALISGSNGQVAWGFTGSGVDVADLLLVDIDPKRSDAYLTPEGSEAFTTRTEIIKVRGQDAVAVTVRLTRWGPELEKPLSGKPVVVRWTALDPDAVNLNYLNLDRVMTVAEAVPLFNSAGEPTLNALLADSQGNIGWTVTGRIPRRIGNDGLSPCLSSDAHCRWNGYLAGEDMPKILNPSSQVLVNANQPMNWADRALGYDSAPGSRAERINERLAALGRVDEGELLALQLDTQAGFYRYYHNLAVDALNSLGGRLNPEQQALLRYLQSWDGRAETSALGLPVIVAFRQLLMDRVFSPLLSSCQRIDPTFKYQWHLADQPLQQLVSARRPELLPDADRYATWDAFLVQVLEDSKNRVLKEQGVSAIDDLRWGQGDADPVAHPLSDALPLLSPWLDMPIVSLPGCVECVRVARLGGATERLVVSPGQENQAILHMPGGQSGHPLSPHYRDQHLAWVGGLATPLLVETIHHHLDLMPALD
ncbi:MAG: penicillin acylase family protein [Methylobacter sp.]|nr:MAG: penicillin acylase family protein [Methylobacter sp.]PPD36104.1 MAG: penicillin acylase family protein [Methylomonas sp.]